LYDCSADLTIVLAALAASRWIEHQAGWSIRKFVKTARRYAPSRSRPATTSSPAADPLPADLRDALHKISRLPVVRTDLIKVGWYMWDLADCASQVSTGAGPGRT